ELLELEGGESVLDVGTGSGYAAAVLDELAGRVVSIERIPVLAARARRALELTRHGDVDVRGGDGSLGAPDRAPFDAISVAAATEHVPPALDEQLAAGGRIVVPVGGAGGPRLARERASGGRGCAAALGNRGGGGGAGGTGPPRLPLRPPRLRLRRCPAGRVDRYAR